jgi:proteasome accessory factor C
MADTAAHRAIRAMDLVPFILENPGITTKELSKKFNVTQQQIEKDLQLIFLCGLPGYTPYELIDLVFEDGVVSIIQPQVLTKPRKFSSSEIVVIKLGLEILKEINKNEPDKLRKITALLQKIKENTEEDSVLFADQIQSSPFYSVIESAIGEEKQLQIEYQSVSTDQLSIRKILPYRFTMLNGNVYLSAYDFERQGERTFRIELISKCELGASNASEIAPTNEAELIVELLINDNLTNFLERNDSIIVNQKSTPKGLQVTLKVSNVEWISRAVLSFAPSIKVISPDFIRNLVEKRARQVIDTYSEHLRA